MKIGINEKYALVVELIQETIDGLEGGNVPFEFISNLDIALEIIVELNVTALDDEIESDLEIDNISHIEYDIVN